MREIKNFGARHQRRGFTLFEFLIYAVILSIISAVIVGTFIALARSQAQVDVRSEVNSNLRFAIEKISQDLWAASSLITPDAAGSSSDTLVMTVGGSTITYCLAENQLRRHVGTGACDSSSETITSNKVTVSTPAFLRLENTNTFLAKTTISVEIDLTISSNDLVGEKKFSANKKTTVSLKW